MITRAGSWCLGHRRVDAGCERDGGVPGLPFFTRASLPGNPLSQVEWEDQSFAPRAARTHGALEAAYRTLGPRGAAVWDALTAQTELMAQLGAVTREISARNDSALLQRLSVLPAAMLTQLQIC